MQGDDLLTAAMYIGVLLAAKSAYGFYTLKYTALKESLIHGHEVEVEAERAPLIGVEEA